MAKSFSTQKKEIQGHINALKHAAGRIGTSEDMYTLYTKKLAAVKSSGAEEWYRAFAKRVGAQIAQDHSEASFMRDQLHSIERILGLQL